MVFPVSVLPFKLTVNHTSNTMIRRLDIQDFKIPPGHEDISRSFYNEIWNENEYDRFGISVEKNDVVLDCGANIGLFTGYALYKGASKVYAYEADETIYQYHTKNFQHSKFPNVNTSNSKIGSCEDCLSLEQIFKITGESNFDFAKIDIEGFEYDFLLNASGDELKKIHKWAIEFHLWGYHNNDATELKVLMKLIEKFNLLGFDTYIQQVHEGWNVIMFFARKRSI